MQVLSAYDETEEAFIVANRISAQVSLGARQYGDFAVLYRTNAQSFAIERALMQMHIPYQIVGGVRFYDRKEVKDILAYLRLLYQPNDTVSFTRIANVPMRGLGQTSLEKFLQWQSMSGFDIVSALINASQASTLQPRAKGALERFGELLRGLQAMVMSGANPAELIEALLEQTHFRDHLQDGTPQAEDRDENISVLVNDAKMYASLPDFARSSTHEQC